ncbi:hypothetical protein TIFTF001_023681 [Ficus carica]|uniref:Uncharacterized protein n=1 Tax=Ficus carica TaxID=3494 RepID=A0AA88AF90_FICCA|nr:hypothetical protein TIFTF001_023681 [Ficus carica]
MNAGGHDMSSKNLAILISLELCEQQSTTPVARLLDMTFADFDFFSNDRSFATAGGGA